MIALPRAQDLHPTRSFPAASCITDGCSTTAMTAMVKYDNEVRRTVDHLPRASSPKSPWIPCRSPTSLAPGREKARGSDGTSTCETREEKLASAERFPPAAVRNRMGEG
jgi:hypothetical protein